MLSPSEEFIPPLKPIAISVVEFCATLVSSEFFSMVEFWIIDLTSFEPTLSATPLLKLLDVAPDEFAALKIFADAEPENAP